MVSFKLRLTNLFVSLFRVLWCFFWQSIRPSNCSLQHFVLNQSTNLVCSWWHVFLHKTTAFIMLVVFLSCPLYLYNYLQTRYICAVSSQYSFLCHETWLSLNIWWRIYLKPRSPNCQIYSGCCLCLSQIIILSIIFLF